MQGKVVLPYLERLLSNELFIYADARTVNFFNTLNAYYDELNTTIRDSAKAEDSPELWDSIEAVGKKRGYRMKGGELDLEKAAITLLTDYMRRLFESIPGIIG